MPEPQVQRQEGPEEEEETLQAKPGTVRDPSILQFRLDDNSVLSGASIANEEKLVQQWVTQGIINEYTLTDKLHFHRYLDVSPRTKLKLGSSASKEWIQILNDIVRLNLMEFN